MQGLPEQFEAEVDSAEFFRPTSHPGVELYRAHIVAHAFEPHTHQAFGLGAIESGVERFRYAGSDYLAPAGSLVMMNPDILHTGQAETEMGWRYRMAYLDADLLQEITGQRDWYFDQAQVYDKAKSLRVASLLDELWQAQEDLSISSLLFQLLAEFQVYVSHNKLSGQLAAPRFTQVVDFLHENLDQSLRLEQLAQLAELSPSYFLRSFQAEYHVTPQQYLMSLRLFRAKQLLAAGVNPLQVAMATGLTDQAHLTRAFARRYGVTPARYQRQILSKC